MSKTANNILAQAKANAEQRLELIKDMKVFLEDCGFGVEAAINEFDSSFVTKLYKFPGDITTARITKVMQKLIDKKLI